jgi:sodium/bile acid cotransporter 7
MDCEAHKITHHADCCCHCVLFAASALQVAWIKKHINTANVSSFCILLLVWVTFCNTFSNGSTKQVPGRDVAATVFLGVALFFLFLVVSFVVAWPPPPLTALRRLLRLSRADVVAVVICGSTKTVALGVPLINVMYKQVPYAGLLAMPLIIYHALQVLLGGLMLDTLKKWCLGGDSDKDSMPGSVAAADASRERPQQQQAASGSSRRWSLAQLLLPGGRTSSEPESQRPAAAAVAPAGSSDGQHLPK